MIKVIRIVYVYADHRAVEKPEHLTFANKKQMETYKSYLIRIKSAENVFFSHEEY